MLKNVIDFMQLFIHYFPQDIIAAGMPEEEWNNVFESQMPTDKKWKIIEPYLPKAQKYCVLLGP